MEISLCGHSAEINLSPNIALRRRLTGPKYPETTIGLDVAAVNKVAFPGPHMRAKILCKASSIVRSRLSGAQHSI